MGLDHVFTILKLFRSLVQQEVNMHEHQEQPNFILKKRLSTFKNDKGAIRGVSDELIMDILKTWEQWTGSAKSFYQSLGLKKTTAINYDQKR